MNLFKKSNLVAALAATMIFASCSKDDNDVNIPNAEGEKAKMSVAFTLPNTATRATHTYATTEESKVATVSVFVFTLAGDKAGVGGYTPLVADDFTSSDNVHTLKNTKLIETLSGNKKIYVGINLPAAAAKAFASEADLLKVIEANASSLATDNNFAMFSNAKTENLLPDDPDNEKSVINTVSIDVNRVVAKVIATKAKDTFEATWNSVEGLTMTYTIADFGVFNDAVKTFVAPNYANGKLFTLIDDATATGVLNSFDASYTNGFKAIAAKDALTTDSKFYIGENAPQDVSLNGNTTYAYVRTYVSLNKSAALTADKKGIEWVDATYGNNGANEGADGTDVYVFKVAGKTYLANAANWTAIGAEGLIDTDTSFKYTKGYVYFPVYLNQEGENNYDVKRNQFINVLVNGVNSIDQVFPGYPGDKTDPKKPLDPTDDKDPDNPDPKDPTDPIDGEKAWLKVVVTVTDWEYKLNSTILQ